VAESLEKPEGSLDPPSEVIHLPDPSYLPVIMAFGITLIVVGIVLHMIIVLIGAICCRAPLVRWARQAREERSELPRDH